MAYVTMGDIETARKAVATKVALQAARRARLANPPVVPGVPSDAIVPGVPPADVVAPSAPPVVPGVPPADVVAPSAPPAGASKAAIGVGLLAVAAGAGWFFLRKK